MNRNFFKFSPRFKSGKGIEGSRFFSTRFERFKILNYSSNERLYSHSKPQFHIKQNLRLFSTEKLPLSTVQSIERDFEATYADIEQFIDDQVKQLTNKECGQRFLRCLRYNVSQDRKDRAYYFISAYMKLAAPSDLTEENMKLCYIMAWCLELVEGYLYMYDDIIDENKTRRHKPTWHSLEGVGLNAINDAFMMEGSAFKILKKYFSDKDYYSTILDLFHDGLFITYVGESFDIQKVPVTDFNMNLYKKLIDNKVAFFTFHLPLSLAMAMAGKDPALLSHTKGIFNELACFFQGENDYYDIYGDWSYFGKEGIDIQEGKCTWMSVIVMEKANEGQKSIMRECYGSSDPEKVSKVKKLYDELGLRDEFLKYEKESYESIKAQIQKLPKEIPQDVLIYFADRLYEKLSKGKTYMAAKGYY